VTNSELGYLGSDNLPAKSNFQNMKGLEAVTGKSNFDISEWMILQNIEWLRKRTGFLAVLCKTAVARKMISSAWRRNIPLADARIYKIDAFSNFGASVDACLFFIKIDGKTSLMECLVYPTLESETPVSKIGFADHALVSSLEGYLQYKMIRGVNKTYTWRSGMKHDCAKVMELDRASNGLVNGLGQLVNIEEDYLYPLIKSSDIAGVKPRKHKKFVIVTQQNIGDDTRPIAISAPRTWAYLEKNRSMLSARGSIIYRNKPDFSIFGIGKYSFAPWKIAISGLYKKLTFRLFGSENSKPVFFDDTVYFLPFDKFEDAQIVLDMLNSIPAQTFLESMVFWDEKRPITVDLLKRLDIGKLDDYLKLSSCFSPVKAEAAV
jgi:hypothetical protein